MAPTLDATVHRFTIALFAALSANGCGNDRNGAPGDGSSASRGSGYQKLDDGTVLRHGPATCDPTIAAAACKGTEELKDCSTDADCKAGPHGKCVTGSTGAGPSSSPRTTCGCSYSCADDSECEPGKVCVCGDITGWSSSCVSAFCSEDADCKSGPCALSSFNDGCGTSNVVACKSGNDTCKTDSDCSKREKCAVNVRDAKPSWACRAATCQVGRPLVVDGVERASAARPGREWQAGELSAVELGRALSASERRRVARHYLAIASFEHASVASFARCSLGLLSLGAPAELIEATHRAALDEVRHAKLCYGLAHAYGEPAQGPGRLVEASAPLEVGLTAFTQAVVLEGCVGETLSALEAAYVATRAADPRLRAALSAIAEDELAHAVLAFDTVRWLVATFGPIAQRAVAGAIAQAQAGLLARDAGGEHARCELAEHGLIDDATRAALRHRAFRSTVLEPLAAVLEAPERSQHEARTA